MTASGNTHRAKAAERFFTASDTDVNSIAIMMKRSKAVFTEAAKKACILAQNRLGVKATLEVMEINDKYVTTSYPNDASIFEGNYDKYVTNYIEMMPVFLRKLMINM